MAQFSKKTLGIVLLAAAVGAAGAGMWWMKKNKASRPVTGEAIVANPDAPFDVTSCLARLHDDQPALAVMFSQSVDADQALDKLIEVTDLGDLKGKPAQPKKTDATAASAAASKPADLVKGGWIVSDNPHVLLFPFVKAGHQYKINLSAALTAGSGKKLDKVHSCDVVSDEMAPSYFFASKGTVLPAGLNGGLPVVTVNIPEVDVEFLRISPEKIPKFIDMVVGKNRNNANQNSEEDGSENAESGDGEGDGNYYDYYSNRNKLKGLTSGWQLNALQGIAQSVYQNSHILIMR